MWPARPCRGSSGPHHSACPPCLLGCRHMGILPSLPSPSRPLDSVPSFLFFYLRCFSMAHPSGVSTRGSSKTSTDHPPQEATSPLLPRLSPSLHLIEEMETLVADALISESMVRTEFQERQDSDAFSFTHAKPL